MYNLIFTSILFFICFMAGLGISTCTVSNWEWNPYKSKADCMYRVLDEMEKQNRIPDLETIANVEEYCKRYDR